MSKVDVALGAFKLLGGDVVSRSVPFGRGVFSTTEDQFDMQMGFLKRNFDVISPHDLPVARRMGRGRFVIVTFDDGYRDNYEKAFPILKHHHLPAAFVDKRELSWWDTIAWMIRHSDAEELPAGKWFPRPLPMTGEDRERAIYEALQKY